jgi:hypothetical protein
LTNVDIKNHLIFHVWRIYTCAKALQRCPIWPLCPAIYLAPRSFKSCPNFTNEVFFDLCMNPCFWKSPQFAYLDNEWVLKSLSKVPYPCSRLFLYPPPLVALVPTPTLPHILVNRHMWDHSWHPRSKVLQLNLQQT